MQKTFIARVRHTLTSIAMLSPVLLYAQPITTTTLTGINNFTTIGGAYIPPGNTVTIATGAVVTFNYGLTIDTNATLIVNGGTIRMADAKKIILRQANSPWFSPTEGAHLELNNNALVTSLTSSPTGSLWYGIECQGTPATFNNINYAPLLKINGGTIQYANCAFRSFDPSLSPSNAGAGRIYAQNATFLNNYRSLYMGQGWYSNYGLSIPDSLHWMADYIENSIFRLTSDFALTPPDMAYLNEGTITFRSCTFKAEYYTGAVINGYNYNFVNTTTAIDGIKSILYVDKLAGNPDGCSFIGLKNGITINNAGWLSSVVAGNSIFVCVNNISLLGTQNAYILGNLMHGPAPTSNISPVPYTSYCSVFLRNCRSYTIEGNKIGYDLPGATNDFNYGGIVVMNCGDSNNVVYRNDVDGPLAGVGIESIGTNRNSAGDRGLKILCNTIQSTNYDIAVMRDSVPNPINGIHNRQYIPGVNPGVDTSAGNLFFGGNLSNPFRNYFFAVDPTPYVYRYSPANAAENPVYRNFPTAVPTNVANTCPVRKVRHPQPSFSFATPGGIRLKIMEGTGFSNTASRPDGSDPLEPVQQWLAQNNYNWAALPQDKKELVYETEHDPMFDGATARLLLTMFEGKKYDPIVLMPKVTASATNVLSDNSDKIYPNPAGDDAWINWTGTDATLTLTNAAGQMMLQQEIKFGITRIDLTKIYAGTYFADIRVAGKVAYQQKLVIAK